MFFYFTLQFCKSAMVSITTGKYNLQNILFCFRNSIRPSLFFNTWQRPLSIRMNPVHDLNKTITVSSENIRFIKEINFLWHSTINQSINQLCNNGFHNVPNARSPTSLSFRVKTSAVHWHGDMLFFFLSLE